MSLVAKIVNYQEDPAAQPGDPFSVNQLWRFAQVGERARGSQRHDRSRALRAPQRLAQQTTRSPMSIGDDRLTRALLLRRPVVQSR